MSLTCEEILTYALPGSELKPPARSRLRKLREQPWKYWKSTNSTWAVYSVAGDRLGDTKTKAIKAARRIGLLPLLVVRSNDEIAAVAEKYSELRCHIAVPIGGAGVLIPPLPKRALPPRKSAEPSRIPKRLYQKILSEDLLPRNLRVAITRLANKYEDINQIRYQVSRDQAEKKALMDFMKGMLKQMGFPPATREPLEMIYRLESSGWGSQRDHFFHSFQNFFLGVLALSKLTPHFQAYRELAKVHWDIDIFHVWLLIALWHDVGYSWKYLCDVNDDLTGCDYGEQIADDARSRYLREPTIQKGMLEICSLLARFLKPGLAKTEWIPPQGWPRTKEIRSIREALETCFLTGGHGSASSLRLYADWMPLIRHLGDEKQRIIGQTVLMAAISLPLHDCNLRIYMREEYGYFTISTTAMPFAALISFIDSIQDDRRDLEDLIKEIQFLKDIVIKPPATVKAVIEKNALEEEAMLWKVIEVRDVLAHLNQSPTTLFFKYPSWMIQ